MSSRPARPALPALPASAAAFVVPVVCTFTCAAVAAVALAGCGTRDLANATSGLGESGCTALSGVTFTAAQIGTLNGATLKAGTATITAATHHAAGTGVQVSSAPVADVYGAAQTHTTIQPDTPAWCEITGRIAAVGDTDAGAPAGYRAQPVGFRFALPDAWNGQYVQFGGAGSQGVLRSPAGFPDVATQSGQTATPLARGAMTGTTDAGHLRSASPSGTAGAGHDAQWDFALNDEMLRNFAYEAHKKVRDVAVAVASRAYGKAPRNLQFLGHGDGGRIALQMVQRYPADFDAVFAAAPSLQWTAMAAAAARNAQAELYGGAHLGPAQIDALQAAVLQSCDAADGWRDGVVASPTGCEPSAAVQALACTGSSTTAGSTGDGAAGAACLGPAALAAVTAMHTDRLLGFALAGGATGDPGLAWGGERAALPGNVTAAVPALAPVPGYGVDGAPHDVVFGLGTAKWVFSRTPSLVLSGYDPRAWSTGVTAVSAQVDAAGTNLSAFRAAGGRLIVLECPADGRHSARATYAWRDALLASMGRATLDSFMRFYVMPAAGPGCGDTRASTGAWIDDAGSWNSVTMTPQARDAGGALLTTRVPVNVDWFALLDDWSQHAVEPPAAVVATDNALTAPFAARATALVCPYPQFAQPQSGASAPDDATAYRCAGAS